MMKCIYCVDSWLCQNVSAAVAVNGFTFLEEVWELDPPL